MEVVAAGAPEIIRPEVVLAEVAAQPTTQLVQRHVRHLTPWAVSHARAQVEVQKDCFRRSRRRRYRRFVVILWFTMSLPFYFYNRDCKKTVR